MAEQKPQAKDDIELVPKVQPRGKALRRMAAELDEMTSAAAMESLVEEAQEDFRENAPARFKTLLDSTTKES